MNVCVCRSLCKRMKKDIGKRLRLIVMSLGLYKEISYCHDKSAFQAIVG